MDRGKRDNLAGQRFGMVEVLNFVEYKNCQTYWLCKCDCGTKKVFSRKQIKRPLIFSCGCYAKSKLSLVGKVFGMLKVLSFSHQKVQGGSYFWFCRCECGKTKAINASSLRKGRTKSCGCRLMTTGSNSQNWSGFGKIGKVFFKKIEISAKGRNINFNITIEYIWELFLNQRGICALSNLPIRFPKRRSDEGTASLDRVDSSKGYEPGNLQWTHKKINMLKLALPEDELFSYCEMIANNPILKNKYRSEPDKTTPFPIP